MSSMTVARDNHHSNRQGHSVASIPAIYHPARTPGSQDNTGHPGPHQALPSDRSHPWSTACSGPSSSAPVLDDPENYSDDDTPTAGAPSGVPRKHICPICRKAFNRPSSLKIHYNTHTGATRMSSLSIDFNVMLNSNSLCFFSIPLPLAQMWS